MLYYFNGSKIKQLKSSFNSIDTLKRKFGNIVIHEEDDLRKRIEKGKDSYLYICPYDSEMKDYPEDPDTLVWHETEKLCIDKYYISLEEI